MSLPINLSWHWTGSAENVCKYMQVQKHPDDFEYRTHLREHLNHLAIACTACMWWPRSPPATSVAEHMQCSFQKLSKIAIEIRIRNDLEKTYCKCATVYCKNRVKYTTERRPLCINTGFSRIVHKDTHFYNVLHKWNSRTCQNTLVLPCKSHIWAQNGPPNGSQNGPRSVWNVCFTGVSSHWPHKNTVFYRVKWTSNHPKRLWWKWWFRPAIYTCFTVQSEHPDAVYTVFSRVLCIFDAFFEHLYDPSEVRFIRILPCKTSLPIKPNSKRLASGILQMCNFIR